MDPVLEKAVQSQDDQLMRQWVRRQRRPWPQGIRLFRWAKEHVTHWCKAFADAWLVKPASQQDINEAFVETIKKGQVARAKFLQPLFKCDQSADGLNYQHIFAFYPSYGDDVELLRVVFPLMSEQSRAAGLGYAVAKKAEKCIQFLRHSVSLTVVAKQLEWPKDQESVEWLISNCSEKELLVIHESLLVDDRSWNREHRMGVANCIQSHIEATALRAGLDCNTSALTKARI